MQWICYFCLAWSLTLFTLASLDFKKGASNKCDQVNCYQGACLNGTCICKPGWSGLLCETCNGRVKLNGSSGFIIDSPFNYSKDLRCTWLLDGSDASGGRGQGGFLTLTVDSFATECGWDHLYIFDGDGVYSKQLASLSGDLTQVSDTSTKQFVAETGRAYVFFYSDLAYNMSGFNVSFRWEQCAKNCSSRGECLGNGTCSCQANWTGSYCERPSCVATCVNGKCRNNVCECQQGFRGSHCNITADNDAWYSLNSDGPGGRASHAVDIVEKEMYVVGGYHFVGATDFISMAKYNFAQSHWLPVEVLNASSDGVPLARYDHTVVYYQEQGSLYMFGGVIDQREITNELWTFDLALSTWAPVVPSKLAQQSATTVIPETLQAQPQGQSVLPKQTSSQSGLSVSKTPPLAVAGHTAHVIRCNRVRHGCCDKMVVIHGYNPYFGYLTSVQEYFFSNNSWLIPSTTGASVVGGYGHSSAYDDEGTNLIFVYGGFYGTAPSNGQLSDRLYAYEPCKRTWKIFQSSGYETFLHSAVILSKTMIIIGGYAHNESTPTKPTDCYSNVILAYDIECGQWRLFDSPDYLPGRLARYGHSAMAYNGEMYIYGGFNGRLRNDLLKFTPADCAAYRDRDSCVGSRKGGKCYWVKGRCGSFAEAISKLDDEKLDSSKMEKSCQFTGIGIPFDCAKLRDCATCVTSGARPCQWCNGQCRADCTSLLTIPVGETTIFNEEACIKAPVSCSSVYTCSACKQREDKCVWVRSKNQFNICSERTERSAGGDTFIAERMPVGSTALAPVAQVAEDNGSFCPLPCAQLADCSTCVNSGCMWCSPLDRCVDMNAYLPSFPYGQCLQWSTSEAQCQETVPCSRYLTCSICQAAGPRCGWCDDGSSTGLGMCMEGGNDGPVELVDAGKRVYATSYDKCPKNRWYFFNCPACQCNGHARCYNASDEYDPTLDQSPILPCLPCRHETTGEHCEKCRDGFYGNALNGGNCTACDCNSQATSCHSLTGKCYCTTKGVSGHNCDKCDQKYIGDPRNQTCFYELTVDFVFTFNLNSEDDMYITKINFVTRPPKENTDVTFKLTCAQTATFVGKVNLSVGQVEGDIWKYRRFLAGAACHEIERRFSAEEFQFGTSANTTFLVMLYDFRTPISITVSFAQTPTIDWMKFFVTFALCFFILLLIAFALWKIKQRVDVYRRRQRMFVEMAQMASRPFASLQLELSSAANGRRQYATPIAIEPCVNYRAAVLTIALRMPTGGRKYAANSQSGLALGSTLCQLTPGQLAQLQTPPSPVPEQKCKRRRPACMS